MEAIKGLCYRYTKRLISIDDLRKGLIHEIGRASNSDVAWVAMQISGGMSHD